MPNVYQAIKLLFEAWRRVKEETIANCFSHCQIVGDKESQLTNDMAEKEVIKTLESKTKDWRQLLKQFEQL